MSTVKLTARTVESIRPPRSGRLELFDEDLRAAAAGRHGRRRTPSGGRSG